MPDLVTDAEVTAAWADFADLAANERAALIDVASEVIAQHTGRDWTTSASTSETLSGDGSRWLFLKRYPASSVASVVVNGTTLASTNYTLLPDEGIVVRGDTKDDPRSSCGWDRGTRNIVVTYTGGYAAVPDPVKRAAILLVKNLSQQTDLGAFKREKIGDYEYELAGTEVTTFGRLPTLVEALLAPYRSSRQG